MSITDTLTAVRYVVDSSGEKIEVLVPLTAWKMILASWKRMVELLEDQEDIAMLQKWLDERADGEVKMISLNALEQELIADGFLPG